MDALTRASRASKLLPTLILGPLCIATCLSTAAAARPYQTTNFIVTAPSPQLAKRIGDEAERFRRELAIDWLGYELPAWQEKCPIRAQIARGAGGETSFYFTGNRVHGWRMKIQGSPQRILDSVLPHEVTHTIFATHFRQPVPRWADEGACTTEEHPEEIARIEGELIRFLKTKRGIRFSDMMWMKQYPRDYMPLYAQGHSLAAYLIAIDGKRKFIRFLEDGMQDENWPQAVQEHYRYADLAKLQESWLTWIRAGRPRVVNINGANAQLASTNRQMKSPSGSAGAVAAVPPVQAENLQTSAPIAVAQRSNPVPVNSARLEPAPVPPPRTAGGSNVIFQWRKPKLPAAHASAALPRAATENGIRRF